MIEASEAKALPQLAPGLYLVATPIGHAADITLRALLTLQTVDLIACEDTRTSKPLLQRYGIHKPLLAYHDHNADTTRPKLLQQLKAGKRIALISDAGMPLIADPGYKLLRDCRAAGLYVTSIPGPSAILMAAQVSGLPTDQFFFAGFLPPKTAARKKALQALAALSATLIVLEAPHRLVDSLADAASVLGNRQAAVTRELTKKFEEVRNDSLDALAVYYAAHPPKGEIVLVIAGQTLEATNAKTDDVALCLKQLLKTESLRDAVAIASQQSGLPKKQVYELALKAKKP